MPNAVLTMEAANLFCGALPTDESVSNHLVLTEIKLPAIDQGFVDHRAGGAPIAIEIDTIIARLECTFQCVGWTPQIAELIASWVGAQNQFFMFGVVRDQLTGSVTQAAAYMVGMLGRADPVNWRKGDAMHWNYSIRGIIHYELNLGDDPMYFWDFFTNTWVVGSVNRNELVNPALNISNVQPAPVLTVPAGPTTGP